LDNAIRTNGKDISESVSLLTGLLIGGLAGFRAMMLLGRQSGKKTRAQIRQKSTELQDRATDTFDALVALSYFDNRNILAGTSEKKPETDSLIRSIYV
jgi:gas vesicle protein